MKAEWWAGAHAGDMRIIFELHGEAQLNRQFVRWTEFALDASPAFEEIYQYLLKIEQKQFASEGEYAGSVWADLAEATVADKARRGLRPEILRATDELYHSLTAENDPNQLKVISPSMLAFGSLMPYAKLHQTGTENMAQRRPIDLTEQNKRAIMKQLQLWLARGISRGMPATQSAAAYAARANDA